MGLVLEAIAAKKVVICAGSGGVGKTSLSAAIGLARACAGERVLVCTIDPAKRLANALGLQQLGHDESRISDELIKDSVPSVAFSQPNKAPGQLFAMMLDVKRTWDDVIARYTHDPVVRAKILSSPIYQQLATTFAGSQEYMAMEKLYQVTTTGNYDLVVLDTPPTSNALDFLDAPARLLSFLGNDAARTFLLPALAAGKAGLRLFGRGSDIALRLISKFTGTEALKQFAQFMVDIGDLYSVFQERAIAVKRLFASTETGFVLVAGPNMRSLDELRLFQNRLLADGIRPAAVVVNQVTPTFLAEETPSRAIHLAPLPSAAELKKLGVSSRLAGALSRLLAENSAAVHGEQRLIDQLRGETSTAFVTLPKLEGDIHDIRGLAQIAQSL